MTLPNPGSPESVKQGCTCPIMDNAYGKGYMGGVKDDDGNIIFVTQVGCPVHWTTEGLYPKGHKHMTNQE